MTSEGRLKLRNEIEKPSGMLLGLDGCVETLELAAEMVKHGIGERRRGSRAARSSGGRSLRSCTGCSPLVSVHAYGVPPLIPHGLVH